MINHVVRTINRLTTRLKLEGKVQQIKTHTHIEDGTKRVSMEPPGMMMRREWQMAF